MFKKDIHDNAVMGQVRSPAAGGGAGGMSHSQAQAFELLRAVPFTLSNSESLKFELPNLAMQLLSCEPINLPVNAGQWTRRMGVDDIHERRKAIARLTWDGARYAVRYPVRSEKGDAVWIEETGERIQGKGDKATQISGVFRDISSEQSRLDMAGYQATHDELTGLYNHYTFTRGMRIISAWVKRKKQPAAVMRLRITNIDDINDVYGYDVGDRILKQVSQRLKTIVRAPDFISRIEAADFGICLIDNHPDSLDKILPRFEAELSERPYVTPHGGLYAEFAISATFLGIDTHDADQAIWQTKNVFETRPNLQGWNIGYFDAETATDENPNTRQKVTADVVLSALNERRISLAYQPIIDAKTRDLHHYECLLRLRRDDGEVVSAGAFIMAAERLGLVKLLDRRALEIAAVSLRENPDLHLALNVSAGTLKDRAATEEYLSALKSLGPDAARVTIELTETLALDDPAMASLFSVELRKLGCAFAIDDFGAGYTTFRNLMAIEADTIKIDGSFVQDIARQPHKQTFVRMMVDLAQTFSVKTVAEMVDNPADADLLRRLGVDYLQGYMFGIPSAAPSWERKAS